MHISPTSLYPVTTPAPNSTAAALHAAPKRKSYRRVAAVFQRRGTAVSAGNGRLERRRERPDRRGFFESDSVTSYTPPHSLSLVQKSDTAVTDVKMGD